jgi:hypothetical protein
MVIDRGDTTIEIYIVGTDEDDIDWGLTSGHLHFSAAWIDNYWYAAGSQVVGSNTATYVCTVGHLSNAGNKPTSGPDWESKWFPIKCVDFNVPMWPCSDPYREGLWGDGYAYITGVGGESPIP